MADLKDDLLTPGVELRETHVSWVFLDRAAVYKVKKPVNLGFLDFSSPDKRRAACDAELRLNARLAPHVYRGVVPITRSENGHHRLVPGAASAVAPGEVDSATVVDWAVEMVRLEDEDRADVLLAAGKLGASEVRLLAERVAGFHREMPSDERIARFGDPEALLVNVRENFRQTRDTVRQHISDEEACEIEKKQVSFVEEHRALFESRRDAGKVRDGHGDLRLEHVYFTDRSSKDVGPTIIDCIEFNERFRYADVCADAAFLSMDLERLGRVDLAEYFMASYARYAQDYDLYSVLDFYEGYRAYVRGKVASLLAADEGAGVQTRQRAEQDARRYYLLALSAGRESLVTPAVIAVGGVIGSGKSTLADRLSVMMSSPIVDTDRTRKTLSGVSPTEPLHSAAWTGAYSEESTDRVYAEVLRRAGSVLTSHRPVILDASFRTRGQRAQARALAEQHGVQFFFVEARAPEAVCRSRLETRARARSVSDGRLEIFDDFVKHWQPVTEIPSAEHVVVDTTNPQDVIQRELAKRLPTWPAGLTQ